MNFPRLVVATLLVAASANAVALDAGEPMPAVRAARLGEPASSVGGEALHGKVVYVDFWASWCVPCRQSMPALEALYRKHEADGFAVIGVSKDVNEADALRFVERVAVGFPLVMDTDDRLARAFGVKAMPSGYLIDRKGIVRRVHRGFTSETASALEGEIRSLLAEAR